MMNKYVKILNEENRPLKSGELNYLAVQRGYKDKNSIKMAQEMHRLMKSDKVIAIVRGLYGLPHWQVVGLGKIAVNDGMIWDSLDKELQLSMQLENEISKKRKALGEIEGFLVKVLEEAQNLLTKLRSVDYEKYRPRKEELIDAGGIEGSGEEEGKI